MATRSFIGEVGSIKAGYGVKKGTAEKGVIIATANSANYGITKGNVAGEESFAVGEHLDVALRGETTLAIAGATVSSGDSLETNATGKLILIAGAGVHQRTAFALEDSVADAQVEVLVTQDEITIP